MSFGLTFRSGYNEAGQAAGSQGATGLQRTAKESQIRERGEVCAFKASGEWRAASGK
jgi:hypothetical protein